MTEAARKAAAETFAQRHPGSLVRQWHNGRRGWFVVDVDYRAIFEDVTSISAEAILPAWLLELANEVLRQDNTATSHPIFVVYQKERVYGVGRQYTDHFCWIDPDSPESISDTPRKGWHKVGYLDHTRFCTAAFTRVGAEAYIRCNGHNLNRPFIYVESGFRNQEWQSLRSLMLSLVGRC